jgi:two-component system, cell cycle sensor histidine kinase and response regulator CckA
VVLFGEAKILADVGFSVQFHRGILLALAASGLGLILFWALAGSDPKPVLPFIGLVLVALTGVLAGWGRLQTGRTKQENVLAFQLMADDPAACFMTDAAGRVILRNQAAVAKFGPDLRSLPEALGKHTLSPGELLQRLQKAAETQGAAREDLKGQGRATADGPPRGQRPLLLARR